MILYTMMPQELIYQNEQDDFGKQKIVSYEGIPLLVEMNAGLECRILRIMSSDPTHYMDERYTPGSMITLTQLS
ncbi:YlzJ-like family protein [Cytobacillus firmus]|uniref:YlzJ-like family protein n=1 Tax=Cytobacillus firmus TaxID=1399 RepID=UPI002161A6AC|nr:YlzJ-like family protein [Cytobacillus firmus]MCS0671602.1 YlzJ-like family protein [Cytobacillus firmus]